MKKFAGEKENGWIGYEDPTCEVHCECRKDGEETLWVSNDKIVRCPHCGKGYKTEFVVWQYDKGEE